ncbi:hypothetical protein M23134_02344 [Microscilla marina ATCC 23134]|uniref:Uncharacterized protein n=1 Tax=Microscilla marina ATCC 23134 TaxID=313606 RepID=A1ZKC7_MICM2|nr:hypothetical protein M23134_02344 [Microscilla marina ATCC 23134]
MCFGWSRQQGHGTTTVAYKINFNEVWLVKLRLKMRIYLVTTP